MNQDNKAVKETRSPIRVQRRRTRGWRMPDNTVCVTRPGKFGNMFIVSPNSRPGAGSGFYICVPTVEDAVGCFKEMLKQPEMAGFIKMVKEELRGKNLACFCALGSPCHADLLLEIANEEHPNAE